MVRETIETIKNTHVNDLDNYGSEDVDGIYRSWYIEDDYEVDGLKKVTVWLYWYDDFNRSQYTSTTTYFKPKQ